MKKAKISLFIFLSILLYQQQDLRSGERRTLKFGVHPLYNPQKTLEVFGPICDLMTKKTSFDCLLEPSKDYAQYNNQIKEKYYDILSPNPLQSVRALEYGYEIFGKWSNDELFKGIILVRKDSGLSDISQLKGKKISFPASTALAAAMMPQYDLANKKLYSGKDYVSMYVGSQDSSILAVFNKTTDAGVTWYPPWYSFIKERPEIQDQLKILHETFSLPSNGLIFKSTLSKFEKKEISDFLFKLKDSKDGQEALKKVGIDSFESANSNTYQPVRDFIKKYDQKIGRVPW